MKALDFAILTNDIKDIFIDEADLFYAKGKKLGFKSIFRIAFIAASFLFIILATSRLPFGNTDIATLSVSAKDLGKEEYQFGVALPEIIYSDSDKAIMYDFRGIYVYSFSNEKLVGYVDFRELGLEKIQGDNPTFVNVTADGCYVRFYNNVKKYMYNVSENDFIEVTDYEDYSEDLYQISSICFGEENAISDEQITYIGEDGSYLAVEIDLDNLDNETPKYKNMYILRKNGNDSHKYYVFE